MSDYQPPVRRSRDYLHWITAGVLLALLVIGVVMYYQRNIDYTTDTSVYKRDEKPSIHKTRDPVSNRCNTVPCNIPAISGGIK